MNKIGLYFVDDLTQFAACCRQCDGAEDITPAQKQVTETANDGRFPIAFRSWLISASGACFFLLYELAEGNRDNVNILDGEVVFEMVSRHKGDAVIKLFQDRDPAVGDRTAAIRNE